MEIEINPQIILTIVYDDFWTICEHHHNSYRYKMKRNLLNRTREVLRLGMKGIATTLIGTDKVVVVLDCGGRKGEQAEDYATACAEMIRDHLIREDGLFRINRDEQLLRYEGFFIGGLMNSPSAPWNTLSRKAGDRCFITDSRFPYTGMRGPPNQSSSAMI